MHVIMGHDHGEVWNLCIPWLVATGRFLFWNIMTTWRHFCRSMPQGIWLGLWRMLWIASHEWFCSCKGGCKWLSYSHGYDQPSIQTLRKATRACLFWGRDFASQHSESQESRTKDDDSTGLHSFSKQNPNEARHDLAVLSNWDYF